MVTVLACMHYLMEFIYSFLLLLWSFDTYKTALREPCVSY